MRDLSYKGAAQSGLSPALWGDLPVEQWAAMDGGNLFRDDFHDCAKYSASGATHGGKYAAYTTATSSSITGSSAAADLNGVALFTPNAAANTELYLGTEGAVVFTPTNATTPVGKQFAFECRINKNDIAANGGFFVGLCDPGLAFAAGSLVDTTYILLSTGNFLGFFVDATVGTSVDAVFQAASQAKQTNIAAAKTLVAATYVKLGFRFDPIGASGSQGPLKMIRWFVDGVEQSTWVTAANISAVTFPSSKPLALAMLWKQKSGSVAETGGIDWWQVGQSRIN